jgi:hypothetical protein
MKFKDEQRYQEWKANQKDDYGLACFRYAENWANMMETEIEHGEKVMDIAERLSFKADTEGITGFMYGCAVSILSECWIYGEELRKWHNKEYDYEGDGVVNPAILTVSKK